MELYKAIKLVRTASGRKQKEVAAKLGVTANYMSLVESGKREPSLSFLRRLATVLGVPVGLFFLWENDARRENTNQVRSLLANLEAMYLFSQRGKPAAAR